MEVEQEAPRSCGACLRTVFDAGRTKARWYKYTDPAGWYEWGQICGPRLNTQWRSMTHSWDADIHDDSDCSHTKWKKGLFMKVIRLRLRSPPTAGTNEEFRDPAGYELKYPVSVVRDEIDDE